MMAYDSQFVLCVLHKGSPVREINGIVHLPFYSEYKIRLKNKQVGLRAKARVWVDGRQVSNLGDFILHPGETLDLERFLDHSMTSGNKFKFVPLSDSRVNDPTDPENGTIKVEFYREYWNPPRPRPPVRPWRRDWNRGKGFSGSNPSTYDVNWVGGYDSITTSSFIPSGSGTSCSVNFVSSPTADSYSNAGATVEGGYSGQNFVYGSDFQTEQYPVTLTLRIRGLEEGHWRNELEVVPTPHRRRKMIKFCPNCGARRHRQSDHFCHRCGTAYHPRYENERGRIVK